MENAVSRRTFVKGAGVAAGMSAILPATVSAIADEAQPAAVELIDAASIADVREYDVVICGSGVCGLSAACKAAEEGLKVACIEKRDESSSGGFNYGFINTKALTEAGAETYDEEQFLSDLIVKNDGMGNPELYRNFIKASPVVGDWLVAMAEKYDNPVILSPSDSSYQIADHYSMYISYAEENGAEIIYNMPAIQLAMDGNVCTGVIAHDTVNDADVYFVAKKGVILATGGYVANNDYLRRFIPWLDPDAIDLDLPTAPLGALDGDAITMCEQFGLAIGPVPHTPEIGFLDGVEGILFVDGAGDRLPDHADMLNFDARTQIVMRRPGHMTFCITDSKEGYPEDIAPEDPNMVLADYDSFEAMTADFGFDPVRFTKTIADWNAMCDAGVDELYGLDVSLAMKLDTPPYHCKPSRGGWATVIGGPLVNGKLQVLGADLLPVQGLYAAGNSSSGFFGVNYPYTLKFGINLAYCATSGYLAASNIASL
ncbi:MAG: FAD-binding protein [Coriobacteriales bacterium]|nr:FAD-binding protein [Coriobacteriales bacterium]